MRIRESIVAAAIGLMLFSAVSCAKTSPNLIGAEQEKESFKRWVAKYAPNAAAIEDGIYLEFLDRASNWGELPAPTLEKSWLSAEFYGSTLSADIFGTRDSTQARLLGTWQYSTHFVPQMLYYSAGNQILCKGLVKALGHMRAGDHIRVYIPIDMSRGSGLFTLGYTVLQAEEYEGYPIWYDVKLKEIINDPIKWEDSLVNRYASLKWNYTIKDTIAKGLYMHKTVLNPTGDTITMDSTARVWQVLRFMDGQLLNTNIDSVAIAEHYYGIEGLSNSTYEIKSITKSNYENEYSINNQIYKKIIPLMRTGEQVEVVATSIWGVGQSGKLTEVPQIGAFEPIRYHFQTLLRTDSL